MSSPIRIFISADVSDAQTALDLCRHLNTAFQPHVIAFWDRTSVAEEDFRKKAKAFLENANVFVAVLSMNYEDTPDVRWEANTAVAIQAEHPQLQILSVHARAAFVPQILKQYSMALSAEETIENQLDIFRDTQLYRAANAIFDLWEAAPQSAKLPEGHVDIPLSIGDVQERLLAQTDRINHAPMIALLKRMIESVKTKRVVLDIEEAYKHLRERTRLSQITMDELEKEARKLQIELQHFIKELDYGVLVKNWRTVFIRDYFHFTSESRESTVVPPFFIPVDEIQIPETLNLPVGPTESESLEQIGLLSYEQKTEFRRRLLLAKDALAVRNYAQAFAHCDFVRTQIDPQSAQLYEYLLITFMQQETSSRIMSEAAQENNRLLHHVELYATRLKAYHASGIAPSSTALHNLAIASEGLSDAALRMYFQFPNDAVLDTGKHAEAVPDNTRVLRVILDNMMKVCRLVHPSEELLEAAVIECCGGGKYDWVRKVEVVENHFRFYPIRPQMDIQGEIRELLDMISAMEDGEAYKIVKDETMLREDLYYSLLAKRQRLATQISNDEKRRRPFTDIRASVIHFVHACLLGHEIFGDHAEQTGEYSFHRLVLEYILPDLVKDPNTIYATLPWFTLNEKGQLMPHEEALAYSFPVLDIVEKILRDHAGTATWLQVAPNIKESVYRQFAEETARKYQELGKALHYADFRKMHPLDARRIAIDCLKRWLILYKAYPETGQVFLDACVRELIGDGYLLWLIHNPVDLVTHPDSMGLGFNARDFLLEILSFSTQHTEENLRQPIAENLFQRRLLPDYQAFGTLDLSEQKPLVVVLTEILSGFQLHPDRRYLDLVYRELTEEIKHKWINIDIHGHWKPIFSAPGFDPVDIVKQMFVHYPETYKQFDALEEIAKRRHHDLVERYFREISEFRHENRRPERAVVIDLIQQMIGVFKSMPREEYLRLPLTELQNERNNGRIRWYTWFLGLLPLPGIDHYENQYFQFHYEKMVAQFKYKWVKEYILQLRDTRDIRMRDLLDKINYVGRGEGV